MSLSETLPITRSGFTGSSTEGTTLHQLVHWKLAAAFTSPPVYFGHSG